MSTLSLLCSELKIRNELLIVSIVSNVIINYFIMYTFLLSSPAEMTGEVLILFYQNHFLCFRIVVSCKFAEIYTAWIFGGIPANGIRAGI
jgi:hypothetical protein